MVGLGINMRMGTKAPPAQMAMHQPAQQGIAGIAPCISGHTRTHHRLELGIDNDVTHPGLRLIYCLISSHAGQTCRKREAVPQDIVEVVEAEGVQ